MTFWQKFFMIIGIIATILTIIGIIGAIILYFSVVRPILNNTTSNSDETKTDMMTDHPLLSNEQEEQLRSYGIDVNQIPTSITPEQEACAREALGDERIQELESGAKPTFSDIVKARECL